MLCIDKHELVKCASNRAAKIIIGLAIGLVLAGCGNEVTRLREPDAQSWPQSRASSSRDASVQTNVHIPIELVWKKEIGKVETNGPLSPVCAGSFYIMSIEGQLWCFDADSGKLLWKTGIDGAGLGLPKIENDRVVCMAVYPAEGSGPLEPNHRFSCDLVSFQIKTGKKIWQFRVPSRINWQSATSVVDFCVSGGRIYVVDNDSRLISVDAKTGKKISERLLFQDRYVIGPPLLEMSKLFIATFDEKSQKYLLSMIDTVTGSVAWEDSFDDPIRLAGVAGGTIIITPGLLEGDLTAADAETGSITWKYPLPRHNLVIDIAYSPNTASIMLSFLEYVTAGHRRYLTSVDIGTGKEQWKTEVKASGRLGIPIVFGDYGAVVLSGSNDDGIVIFRCRDGKVVQQVRIGANHLLFGFVLASDCKIFVLAEVPRGKRNGLDEGNYTIIASYK